MITVAVNQALYATNELRLHMAASTMASRSEISEIIAHTLVPGFPTGVNAARAWLKSANAVTRLTTRHRPEPTRKS